MPENLSIQTSPNESDLDMLCRVFVDGPGSQDGMGTGGLLLDVGNPLNPNDDELFVATAAHVAGNHLAGPDTGKIQMYLNGQWTEVDSYSESDVFLMSNEFFPDTAPNVSLNDRIAKDIALIKVDNPEAIFNAGVNRDNLLTISAGEITNPGELYAYGASIEYSDPRKFIISDYTTGIAIRTDDEIGVHGDSGGPLVAKQNGEDYLVGVLSEGIGPNSLAQTFGEDPEFEKLIPEQWNYSAYVNLTPEHKAFIKDVFENGENSRHYNIDDLVTTTIESQEQDMALVGVVFAGLVGAGGLALYGAGSLFRDMVSLFNKKEKK